MELRHLKHFVALAEESSFTRAAERERIVQSGLSSSIRSLERDVGSELFVRGSRPVRLTTAGRALLPGARRTLQESERAKQLVRDVRGLVAGPFTIGTLPLHNRDVSCRFVNWLASFATAHPGLDISVRQPGRDRALTLVAEGGLDCAVVTGAPARLPGLRATRLSTQPVVALLASGHPLAGRDGLALADLAGERFVDTYPGHESRDLVDLAFAERGLTRRISCEVVDLPMVFNLTRAGLGVALVPARTDLPAEGVVAVPLREEGLVHTVDLVLPKDPATSPAAAAFAAHVAAG
ncbi:MULTISPECIES: LysR family transcriptional regulator [Actinosynnema]|uniref:LysR family transcriptional regulator n=1 Tax=Actinosynnema TaxID=40566 RepID=UPI0027E287DA|nr:LysR family transcriptional regulator [Actinosynnema pretiosum]MCP2096830.1 DNA-binding transcriptional regulator, LysR family [Actinosynnema pretiosum]